ncbi:hypothetical protein MAR_006445 [Mya arenaria]|uniref:Uncharacterized protein n=1 Tax=Mya arenaria TaxID=6604 RepID=A0ABY7D8H9_MYAAR|nr:hypothetical protein MAR_006445 [Mya arenaria]
MFFDPSSSSSSTSSCNSTGGCFFKIAILGEIFNKTVLPGSIMNNWSQVLPFKISAKEETIIRILYFRYPTKIGYNEAPMLRNINKMLAIFPVKRRTFSDSHENIEAKIPDIP